jgi:hypothetical protein
MCGKLAMRVIELALSRESTAAVTTMSQADIPRCADLPETVRVAVEQKDPV